MKRCFTLIFIVLLFLCYRSNAQIAFGIGGSGNDTGTDIAVDSEGNIYAVGTFQGTVDFDPSSGKAELTAAGLPSNPLAVDTYVAKYDSTGKFIWVFSLSGSGPDVPRRIYIDESDNIYITGFFSGSVDFDPDPDKKTIINSGNGANAFLAVYTPDMKLKWAFGLGDPETLPLDPNDLRTEEGLDVTTDFFGNVYLTGTFCGKIDLDPSNGESENDTFTSINGTDGKPTRDIFVAIYDSTGSFIQGMTIGSTGRDEGRAISVDFEGNIYLAGIFSNTANFDPNGIQTNLISAGSTDIFVAKYYTINNLLINDWLFRIGQKDADEVAPGGIVYDLTSDDFILTGFYSDTVDFNPDATKENLLQNKGGTDIFIARYDENGNYKWAYDIGGSGPDAGLKITEDLLGNFYLTGFFAGTAFFDPSSSSSSVKANSNGSTDAFIAKYDNNGKYIWAYNIGGAETDMQKSQTGTGIAVDRENNPIFTGRFTGQANFGTKGDNFNLTSQGGLDAYIAKYDTEGKLWDFSNNKSITVIYPNGNETVYMSKNVTIKWASSQVENVKIEYSTDNGISWSLIIASIPAAAGTYDWAIPSLGNANIKAVIRISDAGNPAINDVSDNQFNINTVEGIDDLTSTEGIVLYPNYPEPAVNNTSITYYLPKAGNITLDVIDAAGRTINILDQGLKPEGENTVVFNTSNIENGIYFYRLIAGESILIRKMVVVR